MEYPSTPHDGRSASARLLRYPHSPARALRAALVGLGLALASPQASAAKWDPVDPADLAATESKSHPGADAEILFYRGFAEESSVRVPQSSSVFERTTVQTHVRAKIYTQKGVDDEGLLAIPHVADQSIGGIAARVVKPDGTSIELKSSDIFEVTIVKFGGLRYKRTQFAFPNLAPGDVVECRWSSSTPGYAYGGWDFAQQRLPMREYQMRFSGSLGGRMMISWHNCPTMKKSSAAGGLVLTMNNVPAFVEEDLMPPERQFRGWIFQIKTFGIENHEQMWREISLIWANDFMEATAPNGAIKAKAAQLTQGAVDETDKLRRIYEFCRREITNFDRFDLPRLQKEREKTKSEDTRSARTVLERGYGWSVEINLLFAALARASGFEVKILRNAARDELFEAKEGRMWAFFGRSSVAVRMGEEWRTFDPGDFIAPFGMLSWRDEGVTGLLADGSGKKIAFHQVPMSPPESSRAVRRAVLKLDEEGTIEGDVTETLTGQVAHLVKSENWGSSDAEVEKDLRDEINKRLPDAEVTDIRWENLISADQPLKLTYHVRIPGYVQRVGAGMVVKPSFFQVGRPAVFGSATRTYPIMFPYAWQEADDVTIELPAGYELDRPSAPRPVVDADLKMSSTYKLGYLKKSHALRYSRDFTLGGDGFTVFRVEAYPRIKGFFDAAAESDGHALVLKVKEAVPAPAPEAAAAGGNP